MIACPTCGTENPPEAQYCVSCSVPLEGRYGESQTVRYCTNCGSENPRGSTFCTNCGAPLQASATPGAPVDAPPYRAPTQARSFLPPRDLSELVSETFRVYGGSFRTFFFIALIAQVPFLIVELVPNVVVSPIFSIVGFVFVLLASGAMIYAVACQHLGREVGVGECYRRAWRMFWPLLGSLIAFLIILLISGLLIGIIIGIVLFFYFLVSRFFYHQAVILEGMGPLQALRRSRDLVRGSWWRVFGIGIVFVVLLLVISLIVSIPGSIASVYSPITGIFLLTIAQGVVMPLGYIGATLVYFDLRIRKEGYTLETMASEMGR